MVPSRRTVNQNWLPSIFNDFFDNEWMERSNATAPAINVLESDRSYDIELAAPGMTKEDFKVSLDENGDLVINMEKKEENEQHKGKKYLRREFAYTKYQQTLVLPDDVDKTKIGAEVKHGILNITLPKIAEAEAKVARTIEVQ